MTDDRAMKTLKAVGAYVFQLFESRHAIRIEDYQRIQAHWNDLMIRNCSPVAIGGRFVTMCCWTVHKNSLDR